MQPSEHGPDRIFPPATGLISARRNLLSHLLRLADQRITSASPDGGANDPFGQGNAYLDALQHIATILDPSTPPSELASPGMIRDCLKRLQGLWAEVVIAEADPVSAQQACDYAQKLLIRFPAATACYVNECGWAFPEPQLALDLLAQASRHIVTVEDGVRIGRAQAHTVRVILQRRALPSLVEIAPHDLLPAPVVQATAISSETSKTPEGPILVGGHRLAMEKLVEMGELFFDRPPQVSKIMLRLFPLLAGPTGAGKSALAKQAAALLKANYFKITRGDWTPRGARSGRPSVFQILDRLLANERLCLHLDECDKWNLDFSKEWSAGVGTDLWNTLDGHLPIQDYLNETKFGEKQVPMVAEVERKVRSSLWIVGSGTWQDVFAKGGRASRLGFSPTPATAQVDADAIVRAGAISPELTLRFNSDVIFLNYPSQAEIPGLLRLSGITALADELGLSVTADDVDWQRGGMRVLETLATRLAIEKYRRSRKAG